MCVCLPVYDVCGTDRDDLHICTTKVNINNILMTTWERLMLAGAHKQIYFCTSGHVDIIKLC